MAVYECRHPQLEIIFLKDKPDNPPKGNIRSEVSMIITDDALAEFKAYCEASTEYEIIEDK